MNSLDQAWQWLESFTNLEKTPQNTTRTWRLDRMKSLLEKRGNPERTSLTLHVAGSKGKGSTSAFLASILHEAGWKTGLYTSPHIQDWRERITANGLFFPEKSYLQELDSLRFFWEALSEDTRGSFVDDWGGPPTTFEFLTLAAFELFRNQGCDAQVLETGLGGRLDATNVVIPQASILTLIELEHTEILGSTIAEIAGEKAGIIKPGVPVFVAEEPADALIVFERTCRERGCELISFEQSVRDFEAHLSQNGTMVSFRLGADSFQIHLPILGIAQAKNAALAALTVKSLVKAGVVEIRSERSLGQVVQAGLENVSLKGRMQIADPTWPLVVDGAHTEQSVKALVASWLPLFGKGGTLVFGAFAGKDIRGMARELVTAFDRIVLTPPGFYRPSDPEEMKRVFLEAAHKQRESGQIVTLPAIEVFGQPEAALDAVLSGEKKPTLVCGSFYLVGEVLSALKWKTKETS